MATVTFVHHREAVDALARRLREEILAANLEGRPVISSDGRFRLIRYLDHGASSVVYEAVDQKFDRKLALKLFPGLADDALARAVKREAQHLAKVPHPNIIVVYDYDVLALPGDCRCFYVAMELGVSLKKWLERAPSSSEILAVFVGMGHGLAAIHAAGFVHRDVKPENVVLVGNIPKIVDFGLAHTPTTGNAANSTRVVGTLRYMSPEALRGERQHPGSDQFSFAAALWKTLCQGLPYPEVDDPATRRPTVEPRVPLPDPIRQALHRALDPDPSRRYPDMPSLLAALQPPPSSAAASDRPVISFHPPNPATPAEQPRASGTGRVPTLAAEFDSTTEMVPTRLLTRRSAAPWLAFPAVGILSIGGALAALGFWDAEPAVGTEVEEVSDEVTAPPATPGPGCPNPGALVGVWRFETAAQWAENPSTIGTSASYTLEIRSDGTACGLDVEVRKLSSSEPRRDRKRVELVASFPFTGAFTGDFAPIRTGETVAENRYTFAMVFDEDRLYGDFHARSARGARFSGVLQGGRDTGDAIPASDRLPCTVRCGARCLGVAATAECRQQCAADAWAEFTCPAPDADAHVELPEPAACADATAYAGTWRFLARDRNSSGTRIYDVELAANACTLHVVSARERGGAELRGAGRVDKSGLWRVELTSGRKKTRVDHTWSLVGRDPAFGEFTAKHDETELAAGVVAAYRR